MVQRLRTGKVRALSCQTSTSGARDLSLRPAFGRITTVQVFERAGQAPSGVDRARLVLPGYQGPMKIVRTVAALGITKKIITEAKKPENQAKIKAGAEKLRSRSRGRRP